MPASLGTLTFTAVEPCTGVACPPPSGPVDEYGPVEVVIEVDPDPSQAVSFSASGLSLGGQSTWKYVHRFGGITVQ